MNPLSDVLESNYVQHIQVINFAAKRKNPAPIQLINNMFKNNNNLSFGLLYTFTYEFFKNGGQEYLQVIFLSNNERVISIDMATEVINIFKGARSILGDQQQDCLVEIMNTYILKQIDEINPKDIKDFDKDIIIDGLKSAIWILCKEYTVERAEDIIIEYTLKFSLKMIQSPYFDKQLKGITDINEKIDNLSKDLSIIDSDRKDTEKLINWINRSDLLKRIYSESSHAEIMRKGVGMLVFLAKNGVFTTGTIDIVWNSQLDKHEDIVRAVYFCIESIVEYLPLDLIEFLFGKIKMIPLSKYDEKLLQFMCNFTTNALAAHASVKHIDGEESMKKHWCLDGPYCIPTFWQIIQDSSPFDEQMTELALKAFLECMKSPLCEECIINYLPLCVKNIANSTSVFQSIIIAEALITQLSDNKNTIPPVSSIVIRELVSEFHLIDLIIKSLVKYREFSDSKLKQYPDKSQEMVVLDGKFVHGQNLQFRLKFLSFILLSSGDIQLKKEELQTLWTEYIIKCQIPVTTNIFLQWFLFDNRTYTISKLKRILSFEFITLAFELLYRKSYDLAINFPTLFYKAFTRYFILINIWKEALDESEVLKVIDFDNIYGLETLWDMTLCCGHEKVREKFFQFTVSLYLYLSESLHCNRINIWNSFIEKVTSKLREADSKNEDKIILHLLNLLLNFFTRMEGKEYLAEGLELSQKMTNLHITFTIKPGICKYYYIEMTNFTCDACPYASIGYIRKIIADHLKISFIDCILTNHNITWEHSDNPCQIRDKLAYPYPVIVTRAEPLLTASNHPKKKFAQDDDKIELIFKLLNNESRQYAQACWELLTYLPKNARIESNIIKLKLEHNWDELLDSHSVYRLLYALQMVIEIVSAKQITRKESDKWIEKFISKEGGNHLFHCLLNIPMKSALSRKCFALLFRIINGIFRLDLSESKCSRIEGCTLFQVKKNEIISKILTVIEDLVKPSSHRKQTIHSHNDDESVQMDVDKSSEVNIRLNLDEANTITLGFRIIRRTFSNDYNYFEQIKSYPTFLDLMRNGTIICDSKQIKSTFVGEIYKICTEYKQFYRFTTTPQKVIPVVLINNLLDESAKHSRESQYFYELLKNVTKIFSREMLLQLPINYAVVIKRYAKLLIDHVSIEHCARVIDPTLIGLLKLLRVSLKKFPEYKLPVGQGEVGLLNEILHRCLFDYPVVMHKTANDSSVPLPPKCKSRPSRIAAFNTLCTLTENVNENLNVILNYLPSLHITGSWRINSLNEWEMTPPNNEKSETGYLGIKNLGCICYMISLLQQLYMIPSFRNSLVSARSVDASGKIINKKLPSDPTLLQLQYLFTSLHESVKEYHNPKNFCQTFKDWEGNTINCGEQMDVDEFFNILIDKLETALKETNKPRLLRDHFEGVYLNQITCRDCLHRRELEEPFMAINLQIKNKISLQESIKSFVEGEVMEGNNAYYCENCDRKVPAVKRVCIKTLPDHLIFVLKRFYYNYDTMQKVKLNDYCEFPMNMDMSPFMSDELKGKHSKSNEYKLVGIVIHRGIADSGHYYSFIQDREFGDKWFEFNDTLVIPFDPARIKDEAFGGEEQWDDGTRKGKMERYLNAYMLFYDRIIPQHTDNTTFNTFPELYNLVKQDNTKYWQSKFFLSKDYAHFVNRLGRIWGSSINQNSQQSNLMQRSVSDSNLRVFKYLTAVMITTFMRAYYSQYMYDLFDVMITYINNYPQAAEWLIQEFTSKDLIDECLLGISPNNVHLTTIGLIIKSMERLYLNDASRIANNEPCISLNFINFLVAMLNAQNIYKSNLCHYTELLSKITVIGPEIQHHLKRLETIEKLIYILKEDDIPNERCNIHYELNPTPYIPIPKDGKIQKPSYPNLDYSFIFHCLYTLLRTCKFNNSKSPLTLQPTSTFNDVSLLYGLFSEDVINKLFHECKYRVGQNSFYKLIVHISWDNIELKEHFRKLIITALDKAEHDAVGVCMKSILIFSKYPDSCTSKLVRDMLKDVNLIACKYQYVFFFIYILFDNLTKLCKKSRLIRDKVNKLSAEFEWIRDYFDENPHVSLTTSTSTLRYYKNQIKNTKMLETYSSFTSPQNCMNWRMKGKQVIKQFEEYMDDTRMITDNEDKPDSDSDVYEETFAEGEIVEYLIKDEGKTDKWIYAEVKKYAGGCLLLTYKLGKREYTAFLDTATEYIAKRGTHDITEDLDQSSTLKENQSDDNLDS